MFAITALKVLMMIAYGVPGYVLVKTKLVGQDSAKVFAKLLLYVCSPALCIQTLNSVDCTKENLISMGIFFFAALFAQIAVILIYTLLFRKKGTPFTKDFSPGVLASFTLSLTAAKSGTERISSI